MLAGHTVVCVSRWLEELLRSRTGLSCTTLYCLALQAVQDQLQRIRLLVQLGDFDNARLVMRNGAFSALRGDLRYESEYRGVNAEVSGCGGCWRLPGWRREAYGAACRCDTHVCLCCLAVLQVARSVVEGVEQLDRRLRQRESLDTIKPVLEKLQQQLQDISQAGQQ